MNATRTEAAPQLRQEPRLQLSLSLEQSLSVLRMSGPDLFLSLTGEANRNPFLELQLPDVKPHEFGPDNYEQQLSWREHLLEQCRRNGWSRHFVSLTEAMIHQLDDEGYLHSSDRELSGMKLFSRYPLADIREARCRLGMLHPPGIGAASLQERLLMQLTDMEEDGCADETTASARDILTHHFDSLAKQDLDVLPEDRLQEALAVIASLNPRPTSLFGAATTPQIPDVVVRKSGTLWRVHDGPGLDIGIAAATNPHSTFDKWDSDALSEAESLWRTASNLAHCVSYRRRRLLEIAQVVVDFQRNYFEQGPNGLRPLRLADIAEEVGVSVTTVSLAVAGKTIASPRGFHALKSIIPRSFSDTGKTRQIMKAILRDAISRENPQSPMSDRKLAESMNRHASCISRRTVAQLRTEMGIPPSYRRRVPGGEPGQKTKEEST